MQLSGCFLVYPIFSDIIVRLRIIFLNVEFSIIDNSYYALCITSYCFKIIMYKFDASVNLKHSVPQKHDSAFTYPGILTLYMA